MPLIVRHSSRNNVRMFAVTFLKFICAFCAGYTTKVMRCLSSSRLFMLQNNTASDLSVNMHLPRAMVVVIP